MEKKDFWLFVFFLSIIIYWCQLNHKNRLDWFLSFFVDFYIIWLIVDSITAFEILSEIIIDKSMTPLCQDNTINNI